MPLQPFPGFIGVTDQRSPRFLNTELTENFYYEFADPGSATRSGASLLSTPGLLSRADLNFPEIGNVGALVTVEGQIQDNIILDPRTFAVVGHSGGNNNNQFYEIHKDGSAPKDWGSLPFDDPRGYYRIIAGTNEMYIICLTTKTIYGGYFHYALPAVHVISPDLTSPPGLDPNTIHNIAGFTTPCDGDFMDGYFLFARAGTNSFFISSGHPGLSFDPLDTQLENDLPGSIVALRAVAGRVWIFGRDRMVAWYNSGAADFPFSRDNSSRVNIGAVSAAAVTKLENTLFWLGRDTYGSVGAFKLVGYSPQRISQPAQEQVWQNGNIENAITWSYQEEGHQFFVLCFPSLDRTYCYDDREGRWHMRSVYDPTLGRSAMHVAYTHTFNPFIGHIVGDRQAGKGYLLSRQYPTDFGRTITRRRTAPHLYGGGSIQFYRHFLLDTNTSAATLSYSNDDGATFSTPRAPDVQNAERPEWWRLGSALTDRVFDVQITDTTQPVAVAGAYLDMEGGRS